MISYKINDLEYGISDDYNYSRSAWVSCLNKETKELILDFTIMWNMFEHEVFNNRFRNNYNENVECDICCNKVLDKKENTAKILKIKSMFDKFNEKYADLDQQYAGYGYRKSGISSDDFKKMNASTDLKLVLKYLIYSCYRIRCNLFHGPKCVCHLDDQILLFLAMNELMAMIARRYGY